MKKGDKVRIKTREGSFEVVNVAKVWVGVREVGWTHPDDDPSKGLVIAQFAVRATEIVEMAAVPGPDVTDLASPVNVTGEF